MSTLAEQETSVTHSRTDDLVYIFTSNPAHLRKLRADARVTETKGDEEHGFFTVPAKQWNIISFKRQGREYSDEEKAALAERLGKARATKETDDGD